MRLDFPPFACYLVLALFQLNSCSKQQGETAKPPPAGENRPQHDEACENLNPGPSESFPCQFDSQCVICHDGSECGVVVNQDEFDHLGEACQKEDTAECEYSAPRCCQNRCVLSPF